MSDTTQKIHWRKAMDMAKKGQEVSADMIDYDDDHIDHDEDCLPLSKDDIAQGLVKPLVSVQLKLEKPIADWIKREQIDLEALVSKLITDQYQAEQLLQKSNPSEPKRQS